MKPFDENAICPKCHSTDIGSFYNKEDRDRRFQYTPKEPLEHIERQCKRCRYSWNEAPLDSDDKNA